MKTIEYEAPLLVQKELWMESFICESIKELTIQTEVDEFSNMGVEEFNFDE